MNELQVFENSEFGTVRTVQDGDKILFCGSDVAKALGYAKPHNAVSTHCKGVTLKQGNDNLGRPQDMAFITEGDMYRLITHSKLESAERFECWVFDEVLPSIRKHGMYATDELLNNPDLLISVATALKEEREKCLALQAQVQADRPKIIFADAVSESTTSILIGELAKLIKQNGVDTGQRRLFDWLRSNGYLIKRKGSDWNMPTQKSMDMGLFEIKKTSIVKPDKTFIATTTKVTGKGIIYFINKFLKNK